MKKLPSPLGPVGADLSKFPFMPLFIERLKKSRAWSQCKRKPALAFYMINLWSASWHSQTPGSLEDDDQILADRAMCTDKEWSKLRTEVLHGWVKCSDQRLHHPVVSELAHDALGRKVAQVHRTEAARVALAEKRRLLKLDPTPLHLLADVSDCPATDAVTMSVTDNVADSVTNSATGSNRQGQGQGNRQEDDPSTRQTETLSVRDPERTSPAKRARNDYPAQFEEFWRLYPTDPNMSKKAAFEAWGRIPIGEREAEIRSLASYRIYCSNRPDYRPIHAERYLAKRRSEGMLKATPQQLAAPPDTRRRGSEPRENPHFAALRRNLQEAANESDRQGGSFLHPSANPDARGVTFCLGEAGRGDPAGGEREVFHLPGCEPV